MRIGSLFSGYRGLDMAVEAVTGGQTVWCSEIDPGASKILAHHWPTVPNHGDLTRIDWATVEPVDILTGGFPCQDLSHAGKRAGMRPGTRSGLWSHMAYAIDQLRPRLVVAENVRGLLSASADSDLEPCPWCLGDDEGSPLRALGSVLGDLADIGYDAAWVGLRAADVGAPHGRFRVFVAAWPAADTDLRTGYGERARPESRQGGPLTSDADVIGHERTLDDGNLWSVAARLGALLPTPAVNDMGEGKTPDAWDEWTTKMQAVHGNGNGHGKSLAIEAQRLLPTPNTMDGMSARSDEALARARTVGGCSNLKDVRPTEWGAYAPAIARWEALTGRPAPAPTQLSTKGTPQLSPVFTEWLMGLPEGHVTGVPGLSRNDQLKCLGNGVVPDQAATALAYLLTLIPRERAA